MADRQLIWCLTCNGFSVSFLILFISFFSFFTCGVFLCQWPWISTLLHQHILPMFFNFYFLEKIIYKQFSLSVRYAICMHIYTDRYMHIRTCYSIIYSTLKTIWCHIIQILLSHQKFKVKWQSAATEFFSRNASCQETM